MNRAPICPRVASGTNDRCGPDRHPRLRSLQETTDDKIVYLSGKVGNQSQVNHAFNIARDTQGVESVDATSLCIATAVARVPMATAQ